MIQDSVSLLFQSPRYCYTNNNSIRGRQKVVLYASKEKKPSFTTGSGFGSSRDNTKSSKLGQQQRSPSSSGNSSSVRQRLARAARNYDEIRKVHGVSNSRDVYVRSPKNSPTTYWFVGKVGFVEPMTPSAACLLQKRIILEYAASLRPQNMGGPIYSKELEIWLAPGDSEMDVVRNLVNLEPVRGSAADVVLSNSNNNNDDNNSSVNVDALMGYNPEIYVGDEVTQGGLRVQRDEHGRPIKPVFDVNQSA